MLIVGEERGKSNLKFQARAFRLMVAVLRVHPERDSPPAGTGGENGPGQTSVYVPSSIFRITARIIFTASSSAVLTFPTLKK